jgi:hypothetical protein
MGSDKRVFLLSVVIGFVTLVRWLREQPILLPELSKAMPKP